MIMYEGDIEWLNNHCYKGKDGSYYCNYTDAKIEFIISDIKANLAYNIEWNWHVNRPCCPGCNPEKKITKPALQVKKRELVIAPRIP